MEARHRILAHGSGVHRRWCELPKQCHSGRVVRSLSDLIGKQEAAIVALDGKSGPLFMRSFGSEWARRVQAPRQRRQSLAAARIACVEPSEIDIATGFVARLGSRVKIRSTDH